MLVLKGQLFDIPSKGKGYGENIELINGQSVRLSKFVNRDIRNLSAGSGSLFKQYQIFLDAVLIEPESLRKNVGELFLGDANTLLFAARMLSFGPDYKVPFNCKLCGHRSVEVLQLDTAEIKELDDDFDPEDIQVTVTAYDKKEDKDTKHELVLKLLRIKDEKVIESTFKGMIARNKQISGNEQERAQLRMAQQIKSIDGDSNNSLESRFFFLDKLTIESVKELSEKLGAAELGINTAQTMECPECGEENEVRLAMSKEFFPS